jgi:hypothetical protein
VEWSVADQADGLASGLVGGVVAGAVVGTPSGFVVGAPLLFGELQAPSARVAVRMSRANRDLTMVSSFGVGASDTVGRRR